MKSPLEVPKVLREALYVHEVLRIAEIPAEDIFVQKALDGLAVVVRVGAGQVVAAGWRCDLTIEDFERDWTAAVALWNATSNSDPRWDFKGSDARAHAVEILAPVLLARTVHESRN